MPAAVFLFGFDGFRRGTGGTLDFVLRPAPPFLWPRLMGVIMHGYALIVAEAFVPAFLLFIHHEKGWGGFRCSSNWYL